MKSLVVALLFFTIQSSAADWWKTAITYEIFVRSFQDTNHDGIGDLAGITSRLEHISSLGATAIWLTPIFASPSYHGYDSTDYYKLNPDFGTDKDFETLISSAHKKNIRVILDLAINHTSTQHPWFVGSRDEGSNLRSWYLWSAQDPNWKNTTGKWIPLDGKYFFSTFSTRMADLNWNTGQVWTQFKNIVKFWIEKGVDGFRLDAARHYVKGPNGESDTEGTHKVLKRLKEEFPNTLFVGEIWAEPKIIASYLNSKNEIDEAFDFSVSGGLISSLTSHSARPLRGSLVENQKRVKDLKKLLPFITNHDMDRVATSVNGDIDQEKLAAAVIMTLPGAPVLYFGEEIGLANGKGKGDLAKRIPMKWTSEINGGFTSRDAIPWQSLDTEVIFSSVADQELDQDSLLNQYRNLARRRIQDEALNSGDFELLPETNPEILSYVRSKNNRRVFVIHNFGTRTQSVKLPLHKNGKTFLSIKNIGPKKSMIIKF